MVAEEVRNLAGRSAQAAQETEVLIAGTVSSIENACQISDGVAKQLDDIVSGIQGTAQLMGDIASASEEQVHGISQIGNGLRQIDSVTQNNASNAMTTAESSTDLMGQVEELNRILSQFRLNTMPDRSALKPVKEDRRLIL